MSLDSCSRAPSRLASSVSRLHARIPRGNRPTRLGLCEERGGSRWEVHTDGGLKLGDSGEVCRDVLDVLDVRRNERAVARRDSP